MSGTDGARVRSVLVSGIKKKLLFPLGLLYALITESYLLLTGRRDSWFYDSPLNMIGQEQARENSPALSLSSWPERVI